MTDVNNTNLAAKRPRKMARDAKSEVPDASSPAEITAPVAAASSPSPDKPRSKADMVLELLSRPEGASLDELVLATGWLPHTTRAALTGVKKKSHALTSEKVDGHRRYRVAA